MQRRNIQLVGLLLAVARAGAAPNVMLVSAHEPAGYLARLLINETPFPGERGYVSEQDSLAAMRSLLLVVDGRINRIPPGYRREEIADTRSRDVVDIITAGGFRGQMDGFYRDAQGKPAMAARVMARVDRLTRIANGGEPGRFARLLDYAQTLATAYTLGTAPAPDPYSGIRAIPPRKVTGGAYGWMTDLDGYHPGGDFVRIPDRLHGRLGGNRFFTLTQRTPLAMPAPADTNAPLVTIQK